MGAGLEVSPASEDASFRRYLRVTGRGATRVLMDAPPEHEDCQRFVAIAQHLRDARVHAPEVVARDFEFGYLLLEDLGDETYLSAVADATRVAALYGDALKTLVKMQRIDARTAGLPAYDDALLRDELGLFPEWFLGRHLGLEVPAWLATVEDLLVENARSQPQVFVHRDFHSRNLMVVAIDNPGVLDFQDAVSGPVTYDLVSLLRDAYLEWPDDRIEAWIDEYLGEAARAGIDTGNDRAQFRRWFDLMGVQRQLKVAGIFARLAHRDGKTGYIDDIPRVLDYARSTCTRYPELSELGAWLEATVRPAMRTRGTPR